MSFSARALFSRDLYVPSEIPVFYVPMASAKLLNSFLSPASFLRGFAQILTTPFVILLIEIFYRSSAPKHLLFPHSFRLLSFISCPFLSVPILLLQALLGARCSCLTLSSNASVHFVRPASSARVFRLLPSQPELV